MLPLVNGKYEPLFNGRYVAPLLPLGFVLLVIGVATLVDLGVRVVLASRGGQDGRAPRMISAAILALLTLPPLLSLNGYVDATLRDGPNNRELYRAAEIVGAAAETGRPVLVDASISGTRQSTGREGTGVLEYLLILDGRLDVRRDQPNDLALAVERGEGELAIVAPRLLQRLDKDFITEAPPGEDVARRRRRAGFVIVRIVGPA
jgi:hypothetical protein